MTNHAYTITVTRINSPDPGQGKPLCFTGYERLRRRVLPGQLRYISARWCPVGI